MSVAGPNAARSRGRSSVQSTHSTAQPPLGSARTRAESDASGMTDDDDGGPIVASAAAGAAVVAARTRQDAASTHMSRVERTGAVGEWMLGEGGLRGLG